MPITYDDKTPGDLFTSDDANEIKNNVNPRTGETFNPVIGVQLDKLGGTDYEPYLQDSEMVIKKAPGDIIYGAAKLPLIVDGTGISFEDDWAIIHPKSDTASTTPGDVDDYVIWKDSLGIWYSITNMGDIIS